jgi:hypothetical protein
VVAALGTAEDLRSLGGESAPPGASAARASGRRDPASGPLSTASMVPAPSAWLPGGAMRDFVVRGVHHVVGVVAFEQHVEQALPEPGHLRAARARGRRSSRRQLELAADDAERIAGAEGLQVEVVHVRLAGPVELLASSSSSPRRSARNGPAACRSAVVCRGRRRSAGPCATRAALDEHADRGSPSAVGGIRRLAASPSARECRNP